jgi:hypothetical protein
LLLLSPDIVNNICTRSLEFARATGELDAVAVAVAEAVELVAMVLMTAVSLGDNCGDATGEICGEHGADPRPDPPRNARDDDKVREICGAIEVDESSEMAVLMARIQLMIVSLSSLAMHQVRLLVSR